MPRQGKIGIAVLGVRGYAAKLIEKISESGRYDLKWCYHYDRSVVSSFSGKYCCRGTNELDELLDDKAVEAVFVITPNEFHYDQVHMALSAGKHVFVEKPMTAVLAEADKLKALLAGRKSIFMVGHNYRRKSGIRKIRSMLQSGVLGIPVSLEFVNSHGGAFNFTPGQWRADDKRCPGGPLTMLGTHSFDTVEYLLGSVQSVFCRVKNICAPIKAVDTSTCILETKEGALAYLSHNYNVPSSAYLELHASEGAVRYDLDSDIISYRTGRDVNCVPARTDMIKLSVVDDRLEEITEFADAIREEKDIETGLKEGWRAVAFVESALLSSQTRSSVDIPLFEEDRHDKR